MYEGWHTEIQEIVTDWYLITVEDGTHTQTIQLAMWVKTDLEQHKYAVMFSNRHALPWCTVKIVNG